MKPIQGCHLITAGDLHWRPSNLMRIPNADYLERTGSENLGARLWRLPPKSANTLHKHIRAEEFYFVLEGTGRRRVRPPTLPTPRNITEQPWVVLHELAHADHDQVLGFDEPRIVNAYENFRRRGRGDRALLYDGSRVRHYGLTDPKEFFAEMTEFYFGVDDFFPFNRAELMTAEPEIYELMQAVWGPVAGKAVKPATAARQSKFQPISN